MLKNCKYCGRQFNGKSKNKYCCHECYVQFRVENFGVDPSTVTFKKIVKFQGLKDGVIECVVEGCDWCGQHLSSHLVIAHGLRADDVKMALGFNLSTGLVTTELSEVMGERPQVLATIAKHEKVPNANTKKPRRHGSQEGNEKIKTTQRVNRGAVVRVAGLCLVCGKPAIIKGDYGRKLYCSTKCRSRHYYTAESKELECLVCGKKFDAPIGQYKRGDVSVKVCSIRCRQKRAGHIARGTWPGDVAWKTGRVT